MVISESILNYRNGLDVFFSDPTLSYSPTEPEVRLVSEDFRKGVVLPLLNEENNISDELWKASQNTHYSDLERSHLLYLCALSKKNDETAFIAYMEASAQTFNEEVVSDAVKQRKRVLDLVNTIPVLIEQGHNFSQAWGYVLELLDLSRNSGQMGSYDLAMVFINGLQIVPHLGQTKVVKDFIDQAAIYFETHLERVPVSLRPAFATKLARFFEENPSETFKSAMESNREIYRALEPEGALRDVATLNNNQLELDMYLVMAALDTPGYADQKENFMHTYAARDKVEDPDVREDLGHILLEEGLFYKRRDPIERALEIFEDQGHEFHLAEAKIRILDEFSAFYHSVDDREAAIFESWRPIERRLGSGITELFTTCLDVGEITETNVRAAVDSALDPEAALASVVEPALERISQLESLPPLVQTLARVIVKNFNTGLGAVATPLDLIRMTLKKAQMKLYDAIEAERFERPETLSLGSLQAAFGLGSIQVEAGEDKGVKIVEVKNRFIANRQAAQPEIVFQEIRIPLGPGSTCVVRKDSKPLLVDSEVYLLTKFCRNLYDSDILESSQTDSWEALIKPDPVVEILKDEDLDDHYYDGKTFRQIFEAVHQKEANVDLIPIGIREWVVLTDKQTGMPLAFLSLNEVDEFNYAFKVEGLPEDPVECLAEVKKTAEDGRLTFDQLLEITNMGVVHRFLSREMMAVLFWHTAQHVASSSQLADFAVITIQSMLQKLYRILGLKFPCFGNIEEPLDWSRVMERFEGSPNYDVEREGPWLARGKDDSSGRQTRGFIVFLQSVFKADRLKTLAKKFDPSIQ